MNTQLFEILQLSVAERIQLIEHTSDSITNFPEAVLLTEEQEADLNAVWKRVEPIRARAFRGTT